MADFFKNPTQFTKTRLQLSFWYSCILLLILLAFSFALSITYNNDVTRIVLKQDFGNRVPKKLSQNELRLVVAQVRELRRTSRLDLIIIDIVTLFIGAGFSYFLSGRTLDPIKKNMESQKVFIADASHELRSPVTTIQTACEVVLRTSTKTKEAYKKVVEQVFDESKRLGRLVDDLLMLSVLDTGNKSKEFHICLVSEIVEKKLETMTSVFKKSGLLLEKSIEPQVFMYGDADKIQQLLVILLDNAIKFTPKNGKVSVIVSNTIQPQIVVTDTGIGIDVQKHQAIFRRFYQGDISHSGSGAGLGLAIAKSIMQLHNGHITVQSANGKGSTFTCIFPVPPSMKNADSTS